MIYKIGSNLFFVSIICFFIFPQSLSASEVTTSYDFRFRYEYTDDSSKSSKRRRNRIRSRLGFQYSDNERLKIKIRLATAEENTTSANQTLGTGFTLSDIGMDQAYIDYLLTASSSVSLGKIANPFFKPNKSQLLFDGDYNPEGIAIGHKKAGFFGNIGLIKFDEGGPKAVNIIGLQAGLNKKVSADTSYKIAVAQYNFDDIKGRPASDITWNGKLFGNPVDANNYYLNNYNVTNLSAEMKTTIGSDLLPITYFVDFAKNSKAEENDTAFLIGAKLTLNDRWKATYFYKDAEANAVFAALVDSDFGGGGVGHKGHQLNLSYNFSKKLSVELTWFDNQKKMNIDYKKMFIDFKYKL